MITFTSLDESEKILSESVSIDRSNDKFCAKTDIFSMKADNNLIKMPDIGDKLTEIWVENGARLSEMEA